MCKEQGAKATSEAHENETKRNENDENTPQGKWQNVTALKPGHGHGHGHGHGLGPLASGCHRSWQSSWRWGLKALPKIRPSCKSAYDSNRTRTFLPAVLPSLLCVLHSEILSPANRIQTHEASE